MKVFVPSADNEFLVDKEGGPLRIDLRAGFILATHDSMFSLKGGCGAVLSEPQCDFYSARRLEGETKVEGVSVLEEPGEASGGVVTSEVVLPVGALLLLSFNRNAQGEREWFGVRPVEEVQQGLWRIDGVDVNGNRRAAVPFSDVCSVSSTHDPWTQRYNLGRWKDDVQAQAHWDDVGVQERLGLIY